MGRIGRQNRRRGYARQRFAEAAENARQLLEAGGLAPEEARHLRDLLRSAELAASETINSGRERDAILSNSAFEIVNDYIERIEVKYDLAVGGSLSSDSAGSNDLLELMESPANLVDLFERDPAEFMTSWRDLSAEDRSIVMQRLQTQMQMDNQITQMITNLMKALHDTSMSVARNLKV